jgi:hypothetical protein
MAALYREVVLKEKPAVAENGFIPLGALAMATERMAKQEGNGNGAHAAKPEVCWSRWCGRGGWARQIRWRTTAGRRDDDN